MAYFPILFFLTVMAVVVALIVRKRRRDQAGRDLLGPPPRLRSSGRMPPPAPNAAYEAQLRALVDAGQIIQAVKLVHDTTGLGLAESKAIVDEMR